MSDMLQELEVKTRIDEYEREVAALMQEGMVVVEEERHGISVPAAVVLAGVLAGVIAVACARADAKITGSTDVPLDGRGSAVTREFTPAPTATAEPKVTSTPEAPKPLPDVISSETLKEANRGVVVQTPVETERTRAESVASGGYKIPIPDKFLELGGGVVSDKQGRELAFTIPASVQSIEFPALIRGQVVKVGRLGAVSNLIRVKDESGLILNLGFPLNNSNILVKVGDRVEPQTIVFSAGRNKEFEDHRLSLGNPSNTLVVLALSNPDGSVFSLTKDNIQTDSSGRIIAVSNPVGKG